MRGMGKAGRGMGAACKGYKQGGMVAARGYSKGGSIMASASVRKPKKPSAVGAGITQGNLMGGGIQKQPKKATKNLLPQPGMDSASPGMAGALPADDPVAITLGPPPKKKRR